MKMAANERQAVPHTCSVGQWMVSFRNSLISYQTGEDCSTVGLFLSIVGLFMKWATLAVKNCISGWHDDSVLKGTCLRAWPSEFNAQNMKVWRSELTTQGSLLMCVYPQTCISNVCVCTHKHVFLKGIFLLTEKLSFLFQRKHGDWFQISVDTFCFQNDNLGKVTIIDP